MAIDVKQVVEFDKEEIASLLKKEAEELLQKIPGLTVKQVDFLWNQGKISASVTFFHAPSSPEKTEKT